MKTIITTVGTSLLEYYKHEYAEAFKNLGDKLKPYSDSEWLNLLSDRHTIRDRILSAAKAEDYQDNQASAELTSLVRIKEQIGELRTILVTSDTLQGHLAGEILYHLLPDFGIQTAYIERIPGLNMDPRQEKEKTIQQGFRNYIRFLIEAADRHREELVAYNISGGFKAIIPVSTLIASWQQLPLYYIYEESDYLVKIPPFPVNLDSSVCQDFKPILQRFEKEVVIHRHDSAYAKWYADLEKEKQASFDMFITANDPRHPQGILLSALGTILWEAYKEATKSPVYTEGKTDWRHLKKAQETLPRIDLNIKFQEIETPIGGGELLHKCRTCSKEAKPWPQPQIFMFDNDDPGITPEVKGEDGKPYKVWPNNVYSFVIPVPDHRKGHQNVCIEHYYTDAEITTPNKQGKRLFLTSEFDEQGKHKQDEGICVKNLKKLEEHTEIHTSKILDNSDHGFMPLTRENKPAAMSKAEFADMIYNNIEPFNGFSFEAFHQIFNVLEEILQASKI